MTLFDMGKVLSVPTLVIEGRFDQQYPTAAAREFSKRSGARYVEIEAGHFAMLVEAPATNKAISKWLDERGR